MKDGANQDDDISCQGGPLLLQAIISQNPNVFSPHPVKSVAESYQDPQGKQEIKWHNDKWMKVKTCKPQRLT